MIDGLQSMSVSELKQVEKNSEVVFQNDGFYWYYLQYDAFRNKKHTHYSPNYLKPFIRSESTNYRIGKTGNYQIGNPERKCCTKGNYNLLRKIENSF